jgi:hypothetical protein
MTHEKTAETSEDVWRRGSFGEYVSAIKPTLNLVKLKMAGLTSLVHKMHAEVDMLGTVTATDGALRPSNARLIVGKYRSWRSLRKTKVAKELTEINHLLNHCGGGYEFSFSRREGNGGLTLGTPRNCCTVEHENEARSRPTGVRTTSPV